MYDSVARHRAIEKLVVRNVGEVQERKYWRFRVDRWYGGIATADAVGCGLFCKFCWTSDFVTLRPAEAGRFYGPSEVADALARMAERKGLRQLRVSGAEPTIGKKHLFQLLDRLRGRGFIFILETNGILIGFDGSYAEGLANYPFVHVRVSLKGCNEKEFLTLTNAKPDGFSLQLKALGNLVKSGVSCHPAVMASFSTEESFEELVRRLRDMDPRLTEGLEVEELILYPNVRRKLDKYGLRYYRAYAPRGLPQELV